MNFISKQTLALITLAVLSTAALADIIVPGGGPIGGPAGGQFPPPIVRGGGGPIVNPPPVVIGPPVVVVPGGGPVGGPPIPPPNPFPPNPFPPNPPFPPTGGGLQMVPGAVVSNNQLYVYGRPVQGCVTSATSAYSSGYDTYVFAVGCDSYPYEFSTSTGVLKVITYNTQIARINYAMVGQSGYIDISVVGTGGSTYTISSTFYLNQNGSTGMTVIGNQLYVNGYAIQGCVKSISGPYSFGRQTFGFAVGCDSYPYAYAAGTNYLSLLTTNTQIQAVTNAGVDRNGYVVISVIGTGGSHYNVPTSIYVGF